MQKAVSGGAAVQDEASWRGPEAFVEWTEALLNLEHAAEDEETTELLQSCTHTELQARGVALLKLCVAEQTTALYGRACLTLEKLPSAAPFPSHRITCGDIVGIFDQNSHPLSKAVPIGTGVVQKLRPNSISLAFDGDIPVDVLDGRQLHLATVSSDVTLRRYRDVLQQLSANKSDSTASSMISLCFDKDEKPRSCEAKSEDCCRPDAVDCTLLSEQANGLNDPQKAAIVKALCSKDVAIVHGPPGTGKTTTMVAYILEAAYRKQRLLVTAPSNVAVDNLLERVVACGFKSVVRIGHPARVQEELHRYTLDNVVYSSDQAELCRDIKKEIDEALKCFGKGSKKEKDKEKRRSGAELTALRKELRKRERLAVAEVLRRTQVVFATCAGAATVHREIKKGAGDAGAALVFDVVIIDEAAQALEVSCWIPMLLGRKAVLAGDHQQLAACVKSVEAARQGLDRTLFSRLIERHGDSISALLSIQYRMNEAIMGWSSRSFYGGRLEAAESVASRTLELAEVPSANLVGSVLEALRAPMVFVDTGGLPMYREDDATGSEEKAPKPGSRLAAPVVHQSRGNAGESRFLVHYAKCLVRCGLLPKDITVITPYNRQVERLRADFGEDPECVALGIEKMRVNTVDSFQGQEADAVLISLVRSNERGVVGFLSDYRRLNVAVTRARKHVMLVGDAGTICGDKTLGSLYDYACESATVVFVQQLLDDEGGVPSDPSAVPEPRRAPKVQNKLAQEKDRRQEKAREDDKVRERFEQELRPLAEKGGRIDYPDTLNPYERAMAHEVATSLGLQHASTGEGMGRCLSVWWSAEKSSPESGGGEATSSSAPPAAASASSSSTAAPAREAAAKAKAGGARPAPPSEKEERLDASSDEEETPLQAFGRRAEGLMKSLGPEQASAEWKCPGDEERDILKSLARAYGLDIQAVGSGKKLRLRVEMTPAALAAATAAAGASSSSAASGYPPAVASSSSACPAEAPPSAVSSNSLLGGLHAAKQQRLAEEAALRKAHNESAKAEIKKQKSKAAAKRKANAKATEADDSDEEDLDVLLQEFSSDGKICHFCSTKIPMGTPEVLCLCKFCNRKFCLTHAQAEMHGCGEAAKTSAQKGWKQSMDNAYNPKGAGLANKSFGDARGAAAQKLQDKIKGAEGSRTVKKKEGGKK